VTSTWLGPHPGAGKGHLRPVILNCTPIGHLGHGVLSIPILFFLFIFKLLSTEAVDVVFWLRHYVIRKVRGYMGRGPHMYMYYVQTGFQHDFFVHLGCSDNSTEKSGPILYYCMYRESLARVVTCPFNRLSPERVPPCLPLVRTRPLGLHAASRASRKAQPAGLNARTRAFTNYLPMCI
jgi:hypothetical protein